MRGTFSERFWAKVVKTETCWLWEGAISSSGYGQIWRDGKLVLAHIASWEMHHGPIPVGLYVLHRCPVHDIKLCVNPKHLRTGTRSDNVLDTYDRGANPNSRLSWEDAVAVRELHAMGASYRDLAGLFGVTESNIGYILRGKSWRQRTT